MAEANGLTIGVLAMVNQREAQAISKRTKEALAAAKARGLTLALPVIRANSPSAPSIGCQFIGKASAVSTSRRAVTLTRPGAVFRARSARVRREEKTSPTLSFSNLKWSVESSSTQFCAHPATDSYNFSVFCVIYATVVLGQTI